MTRLSTHVLDTANGVGAGGMRVSLHRLSPSSAAMGDLVLDASGRGRFDVALQAGVFELQFDVSAYQQAGAEATFLEVVPVRFSVVEDGRDYHIPLILSPYGYSTYRGG